MLSEENRALERLMAARSAIDAAQSMMMASGQWTNAAGYKTDAALWIEQAVGHLSAALDAARAERQSDLLGVLVACDGEEEHFEAWAKAGGYDMHEHPLHYLFMDARTDAARMGWNAALAYARAAIARSEGPSPASRTGCRPVTSP